MNISKIKTGIVETNTYFIDNGCGECVVIDPGDDIKAIFAHLEENNLKCLFVLLTHAHFDHCNAARALQLTGAKIYMHKKDYPLVKSDDNLASKFGVAFNKFKPDAFVSDGQILHLLDMDIKVLHTPGHTAGGCCYIVDNVMFSGDTLMRLSRGRTDFPSGSERAMEQSLKKLMSLDKNYSVFPGHYAPTNLDFERKNNPYVQF
ncbi:MAG: MBL fold metallo-hydrolase [Firmicutes bacterium]|nr:MBL fold metallo-hydrolase [Bacillota bacterium]MDY5531852.1 MBL fold metallo-hydrolase [Pumilibacteraceae bacterium]